MFIFDFKVNIDVDEFFQSLLAWKTYLLSAPLIAKRAPLQAWLLTPGLPAIFILVAVACGLLRAVRLFTGKLRGMRRGFTQSAERQKRATTLSHIVRVVATTELVVPSMLILTEAGVILAPILAAAGIGGLAIGFGAQNLNRTTKDWHTRVVTLRAAKGLSERFFATLLRNKT